MLTKRMEEALNAQVNAEFWSAYLYLSMSAYFSAEGKPGIANWFFVQYKEEMDHATKIFDYINSREGRVLLKPIDAVETVWASPVAAFEDTLIHEKKVTAMISNLYAMAEEDKDYATLSFLKWFVDEQVEEEEAARNILDALKMIGDNGFGLYTLDKELGARVYTPIAAAE